MIDHRAPLTQVPRYARDDTITEDISLSVKHSHRELDLPRITDTALHGSVEVENQIRHFRPAEILAVEEVEYVDGGLNRDAGPAERTRQPKIERGELVVLSAEVAKGDAAVGIDAVLRCRRVCTARRDRFRLRR